MRMSMVLSRRAPLCRCSMLRASTTQGSRRNRVIIPTIMSRGATPPGGHPPTLRRGKVPPTVFSSVMLLHGAPSCPSTAVRMITGNLASHEYACASELSLAATEQLMRQRLPSELPQ
ncbi:hypothetical protein HPB50_002452 [Hyalomma asiaticum]|uniref:Uncharacterized protein n=1 Tax=Hyalomma asiaticum TaxID=266040 RepID=A0ACB7RZY7_HYAAI|nr:hypothetical protein HPB50_002452 [Hyalomma asiaticum]